MTLKDDWADGNLYTSSAANAVAAEVNGHTTDLANKQPLDADLTALAALSAPATKLSNIAAFATANDTDANLKNRANHTGTQLSSTISDFTETAQDVVGAMIIGAPYDDTAGTVTIPPAAPTFTTIAPVTSAAAPAAGVITPYNATSGVLAPPLPALSGVAVGTVYGVQKASVDTYKNAVTITASGADTFDSGATTVALQVPSELRFIQAVDIGGTKYWKVIGGNTPVSSLDTRYKFFYDIRLYGALGNGTTDDTAAVQAAVDAASAAGGGIVWIPKGTFIVSKITLKAAASIMGASEVGSILRAKSATTGTDFGVIEMAQGVIQNVTLAEFRIEGNGNAGQWAMYFYADKGGGSTGGLYNVNFTHVNIAAVDNGIWLRGGRTGAVEPHQFINFDNVSVLRTAAGGGDGWRFTGQTNQVNRRNCLSQSASVTTTRTGRAMYFGRDPNELANASARYPQGHSGVIDTIQGAEWLVDIESGSNLVFQTPYCEQAHNVFRVRSVNIANPADVTVISPRFASVATTTEIPTTGGTVVDIGDYCDVRIKGPGFFVGTVPTPYVIQNDAPTGGSNAVNLSVEGFVTSNTSTTLFDVPAPVKTITNAGAASVAQLGAWKTIQFRGRGAGAASLATISSLHATGEAIYFVVASVALDINNTGNILLPGGASLVQMAVGDQGRFTKVLHTDGTYKWRLERIGVAASAGSADTLTTPRTINGTSFNGAANITVPNVKRVVSPAVAGTYTIDVTATDVYVIGTQNVNITNITTTGTVADTLTNILVRIKGDATPRTIAWDSAKIETTASAALPTTTVASKTILVNLMPDAVLGKLVCVAVDSAGY